MIALTAVAVIWMLVFFARSGARHPVLPVALGLLIGGSVSNLLDRVRLGHVTDFLDLRYWPAFNLADMCIVVGVVLLVSTMLSGRGQPEASAGRIDAPLLIELAVPTTAAGTRLDRYLAGEPTVGSRALAERLIDGGGVTVDGEPRTKSHRLRGGELVAFAEPVQETLEPEPPPAELRIAYEDEHLLVVDKPAGVVVHPGRGQPERDAGLGASRRTGPKEAIASGPASSTDSIAVRRASSWSRAARRHTASCSGSCAGASSSVSTPRSSAAARARGQGGSTRRSAATGANRRASRSTRRSRGTRSRTSPSSSCSIPTRSCASVSRREERIRFAFIWRRSSYPSSATGRTGSPALGLRRQFLHASRLAFTHPFSGEAMDVDAPLPAELAEALSLASNG